MYLIFVASLNENMKLAKVLKTQLDELGKESKIINLVDLSLPMYDSFKEEKEGIPTKLNSMMNDMQSADGYIFVSPEYNYSLPPVLVNFIAFEIKFRRIVFSISESASKYISFFFVNLSFISLLWALLFNWLIISSTVL